MSPGAYQGPFCFVKISPMEARQQKQLIIGGVYVLIFAALGYWIYTANFAPSCSDGKQNGKETGIDCGIAACGVACPVPVQALQIQSAQMAKTPAGDFDAAFQIFNPNTLYAVVSGTYDLVVADANGKELSRKSGNTFYMLPGQTKYLVLSALKGIPDGSSPLVEFKNLQWEKVSGDSNVSLSAGPAQVIPGPGKTTINAVIANGSNYDFDNVDVAVIVSDVAGRLITTSTTNIQTLLSGSQRAITVSWPFVLPADVKVNIEVGTNVFNNDNFIKQHGTQEKFQQYF